MICNRANCTKPAAWQVGFKAWAKGYPKTSTPMQAKLSLFLCDEHKADLQIGSVLGEDGEKMINRTLVAQGKAPIDRTSAELEFEAVP